MKYVYLSGPKGIFCIHQKLKKCKTITSPFVSFFVFFVVFTLISQCHLLKINTQTFDVSFLVYLAYVFRSEL